jgi:hypothetical protein
MKPTKIKEIRSIIMHTKKFIDERNKKFVPNNIQEVTQEFAFKYGYLEASIETIYKILKRSINKNKKLSTNE